MKLPQYNWSELEEKARAVVEACVRELPRQLRTEALAIPCLYRRYHPNAPHVDPEAMYMLGEYIAYGDDEGGVDGSGTIAIYIGAIAWYCEDEGFGFEDEIRKTFLHELGHHFGWGEEDVELRGL